MARYEVELRRIMYELHQVEADDEKAAIAALNEREDTLLSEEEENCEVMSVKPIGSKQDGAVK